MWAAALLGWGGLSVHGQTAAVLSPLAAALKRDLLRQPVLQADETPLQILDTRKGKVRKGYL